MTDARARVDIVLPCLDEEGALPWVLSRLPAGYRAIVVDNGSTDRSAEVARAHGATVVREDRRGFGSAAHAGLLASTAPIVAFCDADASMDPADLPRLVALLGAGAGGTDAGQGTGADLVLGRRRASSRSAWPLHARIANRALSFLIRRATGFDLHDLGPMRVARREDLLALALEDRRSGYPLEMVLKAHSRGWRVRETDVGYSPRVGRSKVTGTLRGTVVAIRDMSGLLREQRRTRTDGSATGPAPGHAGGRGRG